MRWRGYECKDTGFPIKNVGNDRRGECRNAMPLPLVKARGRPNAPFAPLDPALCSGQAKDGNKPHEMRPLQMPNRFAKTLDSRLKILGNDRRRGEVSGMTEGGKAGKRIPLPPLAPPYKGGEKAGTNDRRNGCRGGLRSRSRRGRTIDVFSRWFGKSGFIRFARRRAVPTNGNVGITGRRRFCFWATSVRDGVIIVQ